jgi:hypothetical protein
VVEASALCPTDPSPPPPLILNILFYLLQLLFVQVEGVQPICVFFFLMDGWVVDSGKQWSCLENAAHLCYVLSAVPVVTPQHACDTLIMGQCVCVEGGGRQRKRQMSFTHQSERKKGEGSPHTLGTSLFAFPAKGRNSP